MRKNRTINQTAQDAANDEAVAEPNQVRRLRLGDDVIHGHLGVERGLVPAATLDDGTQITRAGLRPRTRDEVIRDLVERGLVPAASLDDGTQITQP